MPLPPYLTSGASSRAHHALLSSLDAAKSPQEEDAIVLRELERVRGVVAARPAESLLVLLYCAVVAHTPLDLDFALVPALDLAEGGKTLRDRRVGYTFLAEHLPPAHELHLLLVNTVRKDLQSTHTPDVLAALGAIVHLPSADLAPAVRPLLPALAKHKTAAVRHRALLALAALTVRAAPPTSFPVRPARLARWIARESDAAVIGVLLRIAGDVVERGEADGDGVGALVGAALAKPTSRGAWRVLCAAAGHGTLDVDADALPMPTPATLLDAAALAEAYPPYRPSLVPHVLNALTDKPNSHVVALRCLGALPPSCWDAALDDTHMARIMNGVHHVDATVRRATLRLLARIDPALPSLTIDALLNSLQTSTDLSLPLHASALSDAERLRLGRHETACRALEAVVVASEGAATRGADIASGLARIAELLDTTWEAGIATVLELLRNDAALAADFVSAAKSDPTSIAIVTTIACESPTPRDTSTKLLAALPGLPNAVKELALVALVVLSAKEEVRLPSFDGIDKRRRQVEVILEQKLGHTVIETARRRTLRSPASTQQAFA
ncbi:hypothetical protein Q5752_004665 [Cryptotrichosporon argae]